MAVGVIAALPFEARALVRKRLAPGARILLPDGAWLAVAGIGPGRARRAAEDLLRSGAAALMSFGVAGGLDPALAPGTMVVPEHVLGPSGEVFAADDGWRARLSARLAAELPVAHGRLLSPPAPVSDAAAKAEARRRFGACAVDMESAGVAEVAAHHGVPFVAVRAIVDPAAESLPAVATAALDDSGRLRPLRLLAALLRQPREIAALMRLSRHFTAARRALTRAVALAGPGLLAEATA